MLEMKLENEHVGQMHSQQLGKAWIQAVADGRLEQLQQFCHPGIISQVLTPKRFVTLDNAIDLVTRYRLWFGECSNIKVEESRVNQVGERLRIFYRFLLREHEDWFAIEQQLYCTLKDDKIEQLHLLCSGFHPTQAYDQTTPADTLRVYEQEPVRDELLDFHNDVSDAGSTCAVLTPAIRAKLREMQSGQVL